MKQSREGVKVKRNGLRRSGGKVEEVIGEGVTGEVKEERVEWKRSGKKKNKM